MNISSIAIDDVVVVIVVISCRGDGRHFPEKFAAVVKNFVESRLQVTVHMIEEMVDDARASFLGSGECGSLRLNGPCTVIAHS